MYRPSAKSNDHVMFTTTISKKILLKVKSLALEKGKRTNDLIEEALSNYFKL